MPLCASNCSNRGVCQQTHVCVCDSGYSGADCGEGACHAVIIFAVLVTSHAQRCASAAVTTGACV